jgi:phytanoyl-CoA hydroxylase
MACVEMDAGDVILIHGAVEHMSLENTSGKSRRSFQIHLVEGQDRATWSPENWLQYPAGQRFPTFDNWDKY